MNKNQYITYEQFEKKFNQFLFKDIDTNYIYERLITMINSPYRYCGIFRANNPKNKLIQNITQSREIKFGEFLEEIITDYIKELNYSLEEKLFYSEGRTKLKADQLFYLDENTLCHIEQKIRDDHDSTAKQGISEKFLKKHNKLKETEKYKGKKIISILWFIDDSASKNKISYQETLKKEKDKNLFLYYGKELFEEVFSKIEVWTELCNHLEKNKKERSDKIFNVPNFDDDVIVTDAINILKNNNPILYKKLISEDPIYKELRNEYFPNRKFKK